jgi:putative MATE family efflux protein
MTRVNRDLTSGHIGKPLFSLTWPMMFGMLGMVIFNLVDTYFIGKLGVQELAAIGFCFPVLMFVNSLTHGIGIGTSSLISRNIVSSKRSAVREMASRSLLLGVIVVIIFAVVGILTIKPLFTSLGADSSLLGYINDYMSVWYYGVAFVVFPMIGNNIVRATGDTFVPGMLMLGSAVLNLILDPLLIFGYGPFPAMGIKGAALATVIARASSFVFILIILIKRDNLLTLKIGKFKQIISTWSKVFYVAGPTSLSLLITPISIALITKLISTYGNEAVAAFGVASRIEMFALMMVSSLSSVMIIFAGQNLSKHKYSRILRSVKYSGSFSMAWGAIIFVLALIFADPISGIFSSSAGVVSITAKYLRIVGVSYGFQGLVMLSVSAYNGINKPLPSAFFSVFRMIGLYVPLAWLGSKLFQLDGIFSAAVIANVITGILAFLFLLRTVKLLEKKK